MLGLGSSVTRSGKIGPSIVRDGLVLKHDYNLSRVQPCSTGAAYFNGTGDHITVGDSDDILGSGNNVTMACWFKLLSSDTTQYLMSSQRSDGSSNFTIRANNNESSGAHSAGHIGFIVYSGTGTTLRHTTFQGNVDTSNKWHHVAAVATASDQTLYLDGVKVRTRSQTFDNSASEHPMNIGGFNDGAATFGFDGYIANAGVWTAALTEAQVKSIMLKDYASLSASEKTNLVSWWNLDSVIDSVGASTAVYDNHYAGGSKLGTELVTDGSFANGLTSWTHANVTLSGSSVILYDDDADYVFQSISYTDGEVYAFSFEGTGDIRSRIGYTGAAATQIPLTLPATIYRLVDSDASRVQVYGASDDSPATLTSVSVKLVNGNTGTLS